MSVAETRSRSSNLVQTIEGVIKKGGDSKFGVCGSELRVKSGKLWVSKFELD
jgi:predicted esterase YcpF (UPF0227 family)